MADILPFRAWRYNPEKVQDINRKFSPLFDVVTSSQLAELYDVPNNSVYISIPRSIQEAVEKLAEWKSEEVLAQDAAPSIYIYYQRFRLPNDNKIYTRKGFVSMIRMKEGRENDIVLHEATIESSVQERLHLLEETLLNVAPTHGLYEDNDFQLEPLMDEYMANPIYSYEDYQGVLNQIAIVRDAEHIHQFCDVLYGKKVYLADGHHRLETSRQLRDNERSRRSLADDSPLHYHLMYLTNLASDDLRILPTHRVWKPANVPPFAEMKQALSAYFRLSDVTENPAPVYELVKNKRFAFGIIHGDREFLAELHSEIIPERDIPLYMSNELKSLPYTVLHYFIFDKICKIPYSEQHKSQELAYEKSFSQSVKAAAKGNYAFICRGVTMREMLDVCKTGGVMPQKSTYFYPKVVCGLLFATINESENPFSVNTRISVAPSS